MKKSERTTLSEEGDAEAVIPVSLSGHPAQVERRVSLDDGDVRWGHWKKERQREEDRG